MNPRTTPGQSPDAPTSVSSVSSAASPLLTVEGLTVDYPLRGLGRSTFRAVEDISLAVGRGETLGLVGESGSGKSTVGKAILGLAPVSAGRITFDGEDITAPTRRRRRQRTDDLQVVFQDPYSSLNPSMTVGQILVEPMTVRRWSRRQAEERVRELLDIVDLPRDAEQRYPREFSGGQRQRIAIARALALDPRLIVCDEPVSALDLSTQARVMELLVEVQERTGVSYLFVAHDLTVVRELCHRVAVMVRGQVVETGDGDRVTSEPEHPYTQKLLLSSPVADPRRQRERRRHRLALAG